MAFAITALEWREELGTTFECWIRLWTESSALILSKARRVRQARVLIFAVSTNDGVEISRTNLFAGSATSVVVYANPAAIRHSSWTTVINTLFSDGTRCPNKSVTFVACGHNTNTPARRRPASRRALAFSVVFYVANIIFFAVIVTLA